MQNKLAIIGVGLEKSGTTSAHNILKNSKKIAAPSKKETFFFNKYFENGTKFYESLYNYSHSSKFHLDITPSYHRHSNIAYKRINDFFKRKIIVLFLRDPIHRAFSHYWHDIYFHKTSEFPNFSIKDFDSFKGSFNKYFIDINNLVSNIMTSFKKDEILICYLDDVRTGNFIGMIEEKLGESLELNFESKNSNKKKVPFFSIIENKLIIKRELFPDKVININQNYKKIIEGLSSFANLKRNISLDEYQEIKYNLYSDIKYPELGINQEKLFFNSGISI